MPCTPAADELINHFLRVMYRLARDHAQPDLLL